MWLGILVAVVVGCLIMSVVDTVVFGNGLYSVAWISVPYLLVAAVMIGYGILFVYSHGLWSDYIGSSSSEFITATTVSTPFIFTDSSVEGLRLTSRPQILDFAGAAMIVVWSMAIVVFVSPAYAGVIVLVTAQVLYFWYLLDLRWSSNRRLRDACQALHETSGDLAVSLIEQMEADEGTEDFEPAALTVLRSLRGGLWNVFQEAIAETVVRLSEDPEPVKGKLDKQKIPDKWNELLELPLKSLSGEKQFRKESSDARMTLAARTRHRLVQCLSCGRCSGSRPRLPTKFDLQEVLRLDEKTTGASERWIAAIAAMERSLMNRGQLADTLIRTDWRAFLRWCIETSCTTLRSKASDETIATLQNLWSRATGNSMPQSTTSSPEGDAPENPVLSAAPLDVSPQGAERKDALISDIFSKYGSERGNMFCKELTELHDEYREWQKERIANEKRRKQESDEAERHRKKLGKFVACVSVV